MRVGKDLIENDLYRLLGVARSATPAQIRSAYRRAVRASHPDLNPGDARAGERTARVNLAGRVLLDPQLRAAYDRLASPPCAARAPWYERAPLDSEGEWAAPPAPAPPPRASSRRFAKFLRELRGLDARLSLSFSHLMGSTPARLRLPLVALTMLGALLLIASARPRAFFTWKGELMQPTSIAPSALTP